MPLKTTTRRVELPDGRRLMTRRMLEHLTGRNPETIRRRCTPVACDVRNRTPLYDLDDATATLASLRRPSS